MLPLTHHKNENIGTHSQPRFLFVTAQQLFFLMVNERRNLLKKNCYGLSPNGKNRGFESSHGRVNDSTY